LVQLGRNEINHFVNIFGKDFVNMAWNSFLSTGYPSSPVTVESIHEAYQHLEQQTMNLEITFPSHVSSSSGTSFADFIRGYLVQSMKKNYELQNNTSCESPALYKQQKQSSPIKFKDSIGKFNTSSEEATLFARQHDSNKQYQTGSRPNPLRTNNLSHGDCKVVHEKPSESAQPRKTKISPSSQTSYLQTSSKNASPQYLHRVESKLKPKLDSRKENILRVRKTQTQRLKEALARKRLDEYEKTQAAREKLSNSIGYGNTRRKESISKLGTGK